MNREVFVYVQLNDKSFFVGTLWSRVRSNRQSATFEYSPEWLAHPDRFTLEPALTIGTGPYHTNGETALFGAFSDSAPDRWGRVLMRRAENRLGKDDNQPSRTLLEIDYLLRVHDVSRIGALRFSSEKGGAFLAESSESNIPLFIALPKLLFASEHIVNNEDNDDDLRLLLAPGSSLGGARPKASILDQKGQLSIAKFPSPTDEWSSVLWEAVALKLAENAGIQVSEWKLEFITDKPVLLLKRFDRVAGTRIPFLSAMSMLGARDHESGCYLEMVDALRRWGANPIDDIHALFRRIIFNILISNTDDHLRNHGFLFPATAGWRLSPAYDLNPMPIDIKPRVLSTEIDFGNATASVELALNIAGYFELNHDKALDIVSEVKTAVSQWRKVAAKIGVSMREITRMASAFELAEF
jgi:serine/threonine-protein kinase HipA